MAAPENGEAYHLEYAVRTVMIEDNEPIESIVDIEYLASSDRIYWKTDQLELFSDNELMIAVNHEEKAIYISVPVQGQEQQWLSMMAGTMSDTLLNEGKLLLWEKLSEKNSFVEEGINVDRRAILSPSESLRKLTMIDTVTVLLNSESKGLGKVTLVYLPDCGIDRMEATYKHVKAVEPPEEFSQPLVNMIYTEDGEPLPKFGGYQIHDLCTFPERFNVQE